jgi:dTDP-4-dehydrorhamnose reductase
MRVLLLGATGMLGKAVYEVLSRDHTVIPTTRREFDPLAIQYRPGYLDDFVRSVGHVDMVVNAIGITIPTSKKISVSETFFINAVFPHMLAKAYGWKLVHITTDCVYSGTDGGAPYYEISPHSPKDVYGLSKSFGEPAECLTIRTSIIGPDGDGTGLLGWFRQQTECVNGFTNHIWNGITTKEFGKVCAKLLKDREHWGGTFHVFSNKVTKHDMLVAFKKKYAQDVEIVPAVADIAVNRELATNCGLNDWLQIPTFEEMIEEM